MNQNSVLDHDIARRRAGPDSLGINLETTYHVSWWGWKQQTMQLPLCTYASSLLVHPTRAPTNHHSELPLLQNAGFKVTKIGSLSSSPSGSQTQGKRAQKQKGGQEMPFGKFTAARRHRKGFQKRCQGTAGSKAAERSMLCCQCSGHTVAAIGQTPRHKNAMQERAALFSSMGTAPSQQPISQG